MEILMIMKFCFQKMFQFYYLVRMNGKFSVFCLKDRPKKLVYKRQVDVLFMNFLEDVIFTHPSHNYQETQV